MVTPATVVRLVAGPPATAVIRWRSSAEALPAAVVRWRSSAEAPPAAVVHWRSSVEAPPAGRKLAVAGDLLAVDVSTAHHALLGVADVIYSRQIRTRHWLTATLDRYPGCAVACAPRPGQGYLAVARGSRPFRLSYLDQNTTGRSADAPDTGHAAFVCAMFVYAWLAAGWPARSLAPPCLEAVLPWTTSAVPEVPVPFVMDYQGPEPSSASCLRMSSASGAPMPE